MSDLHCIADVKRRSLIEQKAKSELSSSLLETPWRMPLCNYVETCLLVLAYVDGVCVVKACAETWMIETYHVGFLMSYRLVALLID